MGQKMEGSWLNPGWMWLGSFITVCKCQHNHIWSVVALSHQGIFRLLLHLVTHLKASAGFWWHLNWSESQSWSSVWVVHLMWWAVTTSFTSMWISEQVSLEQSAILRTFYMDANSTFRLLHFTLTFKWRSPVSWMFKTRLLHIFSSSVL